MTCRSLLGLSFFLLTVIGCNQKSTVDYNADVKPILNKRCISCHGGVKQNGGFSLLTREQALADTDEGRPAIISGKSHASEMIKRMLIDDPEARMPLDADPMPRSEIEILSRWIDQGVDWDLHWSYKPVEEVELPRENVALGSMVSNVDDKLRDPIDVFILKNLQSIGINSLSSEAEKTTLLRRASMDLIGVPPPSALAKRFLSDGSSEAYAELLDSLLARPEFGERWASIWLDLARYADSKGYERDPHRNIWQYRDWVIRAFNADQPYDQFIIDQIAGDLLPDPTDDQLIATAFHRNTSTNDEGGTDNEEFRTYAVMDRVNTTWKGLLGTTFECVQCHSHPYDPFMHDEYYKFLAFFNNSRDADTAPDYPLFRHYDARDTARINQLVEWAGTKVSEEEVQELSTFIKTLQPSWYSIEVDSFYQAALYDTKYLGLRQNGASRLPGIDLSHSTELYFRYRTSIEGGVWNIYSQQTGELISSVTLSVTDGKWKVDQVNFKEQDGIHDLVFTYNSPNLRGDDAGVMFDWFHFSDKSTLWDQDEEEEYYKTFMTLINQSVSTTPIMWENPEDMRRQTRVFDRGNWLVPAQPVEPDVPAILPSMSADDPADRLGLAHWLVDTQNPLTARTLVNRIWAQFFGQGIVKTLEDLGSQSPDPSHSELLEWLSWQLMHEHKWHLKSFMKQILLSQTYRQQSIANEELLEKDPYNVYLSRGPRVRLSAEQIRDQALVVSGLINKEMYGPSVMPYQPIQWTIPYSKEQWRTSEGGQQYRRALYTYWKRSSPYPAMMIFDAAARDVCEARRIQTNTPLHALVTLNDPVYMEAARHFAERMQGESKSLDEQLNAGYKFAMGIPISESKAGVFRDLHADALRSFDQGESNPLELLKDDPEKDRDFAALVVVANAMLNMDEFITKN